MVPKWARRPGSKPRPQCRPQPRNAGFSSAVTLPEPGAGRAAATAGNSSMCLHMAAEEVEAFPAVGQHHAPRLLSTPRAVIAHRCGLAPPGGFLTQPRSGTKVALRCLEPATRRTDAYRDAALTPGNGAARQGRPSLSGISPSSASRCTMRAIFSPGFRIVSSRMPSMQTAIRARSAGPGKSAADRIELQSNALIALQGGCS